MEISFIVILVIIVAGSLKPPTKRNRFNENEFPTGYDGYDLAYPNDEYTRDTIPPSN